jgi:glycosyltransferase involved in cell wall biosynthesis
VPSEPDENVPTYVVPTRGREHPILFWYASADFRKVLRRVRPQIVDLHEEPYSLAVAAALRAIEAEAPNARICMYSAQNIHKRYPTPVRQLERRALRRTSAMYPCSHEAAEVIREKGFTGVLDVVPLGVTVQSRDERVFSDTRSLKVGFVARLEPYKGGELAVRAFATASQNVDATLEIVGEGSHRVELEALVRELGISARVTFAGAVSQTEALERIGTYDTILVPSYTTASWKEQFGRIPVQAMEAGTPVIASDSGSLREVVGDAGLLVAERDLDELTASLHRLLRDASLRNELSARGRDRALRCFAWEHVAASLDTMYRAILEPA